MKKPFNGITRRDGGEQDLIAFDNPDDGELFNKIPENARGDGDTMVVVDNPDDFADEGKKA
ncbi:MAG: hypothetical protein WCC10_16780 [Tumebacillaceae bacterium]